MSANPTVPGVPAALLTSLRGKVDKIESIFTTATDKITKLRTDPRLSVQATTDQVKRANDEMLAAVEIVKTAAVRDLEALKIETERERDDALRAIAAAIGRPKPKDSTEALLRETKELRAWQRISPQLDRLPAEYGALSMKVKALALEAIGAGDEDALAALRAEFGPYLLGRGLPSSLGTDGPKQLDGWIGEQRPAVAAALALQREVENGVYGVLTLSIGWATRAIQTGATSVQLVEWDGVNARSVVAKGVQNGSPFDRNSNLGRSF